MRKSTAHSLCTYSGFTLVELIVSISIISILSTISFIGYTSYVSDARDSKRLADVSSLKASINDFQKNHDGSLPTVVSSGAIVYGSTANIAAYQSMADANVLRSVGISRDIKDPKGENFYTYSVSKDGKSYQVSATIEGDASKLAYSPTDTAYAASCGDFSAFVDGNFIPTDNNVLPGLIYAFDASSGSTLDITQEANRKKVVLNKQNVNVSYAFGGVPLACDGDVFSATQGGTSNGSISKKSCTNSQGATIAHGTNEMFSLSGTTLNSQMGWKYKTCNDGVMDKNGVSATTDADYYYSCRDIGLGAVYDATCHWVGCSTGYTPKSGTPGCDAEISAVTLASPQNGAFGMPTNGYLTWYPSKQSNGTYKVYLGTSSSTFEVLGGASVTETSVSYSSLQTNKTYFWKIQACDSNSNCKDSTVYSFSTSSEASSGNSGNTGGSSSSADTAYCPDGIVCRADDVAISFVGCNSGNSAYSDCAPNSFGISERDGDNYYGKTKALSYKIANSSNGYAKFKVSLATPSGTYQEKASSSVYESSYALDVGDDGIANNVYWQAGAGCTGDAATGYIVAPKTVCYVSLFGRSDPSFPTTTSTVAKFKIANIDTANASWGDYGVNLLGSSVGYSSSLLTSSMNATKYKNASEPTSSTAVADDFDVSTVASGATYGFWKAITYTVSNPNPKPSYFMPTFTSPDGTVYKPNALGSTAGTDTDFNTAGKSVDIGGNGIGNLYWNNGDISLANTCGQAGNGLRVSAGGSCMFTLFFRADAAISAIRKNFLTLALSYQPVANQSSITGIPLYAQKSGGNATLFTGYFPYSRNGWWMDFSTFQIQNDLTPSWFVWSQVMGWIDMSGSDPSATIQIYNDGNIRRIKGKTLGQTAGWIDFNKTGDASKQTYIDASGKLHGWAWSDNYGWIDFDDGVQQ